MSHQPRDEENQYAAASTAESALHIDPDSVDTDVLQEQFSRLEANRWTRRFAAWMILLALVAGIILGALLTASTYDGALRAPTAAATTPWVCPTPMTVVCQPCPVLAPTEAAAKDAAATQPAEMSSSAPPSAALVVYAAPASILQRDKIPSYTTELARLTMTTHTFDRYADARQFRRKRESSWTEDDQRAEDELKLLMDPAATFPAPSVDIHQPLVYNEETFRTLHVPVLWQNGWTNSGWQMVRTPVVQWNHAAEIRFHDLLHYQLWPTPPVDCSKQKYVFIPQFPWGFYSRYSILIRNAMISLELTDRMLIFGRHNMQFNDAAAQRNIIDDLSNEGIGRFFAPLSQCQNSDFVQGLLKQWGNDAKPGAVTFLQSTDEARPGGAHFDTQWVGFQHRLPAAVETKELLAPHWMRRAIFDYGESRSKLEERFQTARGRVDPTALDIAAEQDARESPIDGMTKEKILQGLKSTSLGAAAGAVWRHFDSLAVDPSSGHIYTSLRDALPEYAYEEFFEILAYAYFFQPLPRIQVMRNLVSTYWAGMIARSAGDWPDSGSPQFDPDRFFSNGQVGAVMIRRGDKCVEDPWCQQHGGTYRPAALFLLGLIEEERRVGRRFKAIFLMSDDRDELVRLIGMSHIHSIERVRGQAGAEPESTDEEIDAAIASHDDNTIVRAILKGRWLLYNQLTPPACFDPTPRWGFESFLTSVAFILHHNVFTVGHENSNVSYFLARVLYAQNQQRQSVVRSGPGAVHRQVADKWPWE
jgi:hypothetical protein